MRQLAKRSEPLRRTTPTFPLVIPARSQVGSSWLFLAIAFLALWGGIVLILTDPSTRPLAGSTPRALLANVLLFGVPIAAWGGAWLNTLVKL